VFIRRKERPPSLPVQGLAQGASPLFFPSHPRKRASWPFPPRLPADDLIVKYDQSQLLRLPRPASEIIIG
jgi:hypothetical protein